MNTLFSTLALMLGIITASGLAYDLILLNFRSQKFGISEKTRQKIMIWAFATSIFWGAFYALNQ